MLHLGAVSENSRGKRSKVIKKDVNLPASSFVFQGNCYNKVMKLMQAAKLAASILVPVYFSQLYFSQASPYDSDGGIDQLNILIGSLIVVVSVFIIVRSILMILWSWRFSNHVALAVSAVFIQVLLLSALGLANEGLLAIIVLLNLIFFWYVLQLLGRR